MLKLQAHIFTFKKLWGIQTKAFERFISTAPTNFRLSNDRFQFSISLINQWFGL